MKSMTLTSLLMAGLIAVPTIVRSSFGDDTPAVSGCAPCAAACEKATAEPAEEAPATQPVKWTAYGEPARLTDADNLDAGKVLADVQAFDGKTVRLVGEVKSVCEKKGCWLRMSSGGSPLDVFVKFTCPIEGKLIPSEAVGKAVIVEGKLTVTTIDEAEARHYAKDAGKSKEEIEAIKGSQRQIRVAGPSALIAD